MIKLFSKIRQKTLAENKFGKYLMYAFGEIVLVVIGILIAISINNWNENQKTKNKETAYLENLKGDFSTQIAILGGYIDFEKIIIQHSQDIADHYEINNGFKNMDSMYPKLNDLSVRWTFLNSNSTLLEIINSGQINIISNKKLKKDLIEFNQLVEFFSKNTQNNNTNLVDNLIVPNIIETSAYASYSYSARMRSKFKEFYLDDVVSIKDDKLQNISIQTLNEPNRKLELINQVIFRNGMAKIQKLGNESLREKAKKVLMDIEDELKQN